MVRQAVNKGTHISRQGPSEALQRSRRVPAPPPHSGTPVNTKYQCTNERTPSDGSAGIRTHSGVSRRFKTSVIFLSSCSSMIAVYNGVCGGFIVSDHRCATVNTSSSTYLRQACPAHASDRRRRQLASFQRQTLLLCTHGAHDTHRAAFITASRAIEY